MERNRRVAEGIGVLVLESAMMRDFGQHEGCVVKAMTQLPMRTLVETSHLVSQVFFSLGDANAQCSVINDGEY